jgi:heme exporter protein A
VKLEVNQLAAERGGRAVFSDLSFAVESGTLLRVTGANGAGKTTLLRILSGLGAPVSGDALWYSSTGAAQRPGEATCFVGHANAFNESLSVTENLSYAGSLAGLATNSEQFVSALDAFGVKALRNRSFGALSQGQKKRCSLARMLLAPKRGSRAWLLDEPFVALDVDTQALLAQLISAELAAGALVIYTSHQAVEISAPVSRELSL